MHLTSHNVHSRLVQTVGQLKSDTRSLAIDPDPRAQRQADQLVDVRIDLEAILNLFPPTARSDQS